MSHNQRSQALPPKVLALPSTTAALPPSARSRRERVGGRRGPPIFRRRHILPPPVGSGRERDRRGEASGRGGEVQSGRS
uniref:Uncharacterized protein n=1 Tax=Oryza sativa subsp. japonica TaxID=39947 RepID=Q6ZCE7_ORYSJ|nr:hypothetical protein [Oryza sativa Japonica Group]BAD11552.1 hypothetical protein [Oryza sativa Japonica Group]